MTIGQSLTQEHRQKIVSFFSEPSKSFKRKFE